MKIVLIYDAFSKQMGYLGNVLPRYLAGMGFEVHLLTSSLSLFHKMSGYEKTNDNFSITTSLTGINSEKFEGYTIHVLSHKIVFGYIRLIGCRDKLLELKPNIVQVLTAVGWIPYESAFWQPYLGYKLFTANHTTASVFPLAQKKYPKLHPLMIKNTLVRGFPGSITCLYTQKCFAATVDCAEVAIKFMGISKDKVEIIPLGVDTNIFKPSFSIDDHTKRFQIRKELGFLDNEIVCVYSGRFTTDKNPLLLARAINNLSKSGYPFRGLFIGNGVQKIEIEKLSGNIIIDYMPVDKLGDFYRASDIGVWPTQESTSMIDAAACGLPIIVNNTIAATERVQGNGLLYQLNDLDDLINTIKKLLDPLLRDKLGKSGSAKMYNRYSWDKLINLRVSFYLESIK